MKEKITLGEFVEYLYYFAKKFGEEAIEHELLNEDSPFKEADRGVFIHERVIMIFWLIDMMIADKDKKIMGALHARYFKDKGLPNTIKSQESREEFHYIMKRYKEYYNAWDSKAGTEQWLLGGTIAKNILLQDKPILNALTTYSVIMDFFLLMKQLKESIFDRYELNDGQVVS